MQNAGVRGQGRWRKRIHAYQCRAIKRRPVIGSAPGARHRWLYGADDQRGACAYISRRALSRRPGAGVHRILHQPGRAPRRQLSRLVLWSVSSSRNSPSPRAKRTMAASSSYVPAIGMLASPAVPRGCLRIQAPQLSAVARHEPCEQAAETSNPQETEPIPVQSVAIRQAKLDQKVSAASFHDASHAPVVVVSACRTAARGIEIPIAAEYMQSPTSIFQLTVWPSYA